MNKLTRNKILVAIENAAPMHLVDGAWELLGTAEADHLNLPNLRDAADTKQIDVSVDPVTLPKYCVPASSPEELTRILETYLDINYEHLSKTERKGEIQHEAEHGEAAIMLGAKSVTYYLELHKSDDGDMLGWRLAHCAQGLITTKLGLAILDVYPREPSEGDLKQMELLGYHSISEVAKSAAKYNLPIPLSAR